MKKLIFILVVTSAFFSCQKQNVSPTVQIDTVYKTQIKQDTVKQTTVDTVKITTVKTDTIRSVDSILYNPAQTIQKQWNCWKSLQYQNGYLVSNNPVPLNWQYTFTSDSLHTVTNSGTSTFYGSAYVTYGASSVTTESNPADSASYRTYQITNDPTTGGYILTCNYALQDIQVKVIWYLR